MIKWVRDKLKPPLHYELVAGLGSKLSSLACPLRPRSLGLQRQIPLAVRRDGFNHSGQSRCPAVREKARQEILATRLNLAQHPWALEKGLVKLKSAFAGRKKAPAAMWSPKKGF